MRRKTTLFYTASALGLLGAHGALAQSTATAETTQLEEIVVTGIRGSLEKAAEIKRESVQVVDSIVAEDIGKFPDPTTAAALQRVPGVQVSIGNNNEIVGVLIRGLSDIQTTLDGREFFTTTGRSFTFQDLPADALARVDVIKSTTADLIEGGIAGVTDLRLQKPFNFNDPTVVVGARANYATNVEEVNPQLSVLMTDRWDTGIGELGALLNVSWSDTDFSRPVVYAPIRRSMGFRYNQPDLMIQNVAGGVNHYGSYQRPQANAAFQLQATDELQLYADAVFAGYRSEHQSAFIESQFFSANTGVQDVGEPSGDCFLARVNADGFNPNAVQLANNAFTVRNVCNVTSATFTNATAFTSSQSRDESTDNYLGALGARWEGERLNLKGEVSFQDSTFEQEVFIVDIGKRIPTITVNSDFNDGGLYNMPGNPLGSADGMYFRNGLNQNFNKSTGDMFATQFDADYRLDSFITKLEAGLRYADRGAEFEQAQVNRTAPGGDLNTLVSAAGVPDNFYSYTPGIPRINGGAPALVPNPDYLRSDAGRALLRQFFGFGDGSDPVYAPERHFDATEKTYAGYVQATYETQLGSSILDGVIGVRPTRTERSISGAGLVSNVIVPVSADTTDTDVLPNFSARLVITDGLQARLNYSKTIRRPGFSALNPGINYIVATNPSVINSGSAGNPDLKPQTSDSYDATLEYYFDSGFVAAGVYYRDIKDRVINGVTAEVIDGITYNITRPRNVATAELQGVEIGGQMFFDFLPGAWAGFGVFGNYTWADSEVKADQTLEGFPLQGVSEHNFNAGLLYERSGWSARAVYTYRSKYFDEDLTGGNALRPIDNTAFLSYVRAAGRLDFSVGYDITEAVRVDLGGTNVLGSRYRSYMGESYFNRDYRYDDSIYTLGMRVRF
ncbi:MAG TPA: TonB-dependent receptor [Steroidobacter sp.]|uniref:TonB-dependent receptor n=1 Tax=Steroidobacter sp. TaxID=1978227 RepID=UPI002ED93FB5